MELGKSLRITNIQNKVVTQICVQINRLNHILALGNGHGIADCFQQSSFILAQLTIFRGNKSINSGLQCNILSDRTHTTHQGIGIKATQTQRADNLTGSLTGIADHDDALIAGQLIQIVDNLNKGNIHCTLDVTGFVVSGTADIQNQRIASLSNFQNLGQLQHILAVSLLKVGLCCLISCISRFSRQSGHRQSQHHS